MARNVKRKKKLDPAFIDDPLASLVDRDQAHAEHGYVHHHIAYHGRGFTVEKAQPIFQGLRADRQWAELVEALSRPMLNSNVKINIPHILRPNGDMTFFNALEYMQRWAQSPAYPYTKLDRAIIQKFPDVIRQLSKGRVHFELCVGFGATTAEITRVAGAGSTETYLVDVSASAAQTAKAAVEKAAEQVTGRKQSEKIKIVIGDFFDPETFVLENLDGQKEHLLKKWQAENKPVICWILGVTANDFNLDKLLKWLHDNLPSNSIVGLSYDMTERQDVIRAAYCQPVASQLFVNSVSQKIWDEGYVKFDPRTIGVAMEVTEKDGVIQIHPSVGYKTFDKNGIAHPYGLQRFEPITKTPENIFNDKCDEHGMAIYSMLSTTLPGGEGVHHGLCIIGHNDYETKKAFTRLVPSAPVYRRAALG